jgi:hypothetical protein
VDSCLPRWLALLAALTLGAGAARAGILLEGEAGGRPLRVEIGRDPGRALATVAEERYLVEIGRSRILLLDGDPPRPLPVAAPAPTAAATLERWSAGPMVAGHGSVYHVLIEGDRLCGEVLASPWMTDAATSLVRTMELLEAALPALAPQALAPGCAPVGFGTLAGDGFPLLAGAKGEPRFRVDELRFDHYPAEADRALTPAASSGGSRVP